MQFIADKEQFASNFGSNTETKLGSPEVFFSGKDQGPWGHGVRRNICETE